MDKFTQLTGIAAPMDLINVDTDMIIPKQFLKTIKRTGLGKYLFFDMRFDDEGKENSDFLLNKEPYNKAKILIGADNFGCGSSREHAPWAIKDFGITCVIAPSFADIFYNNCFKNGILPITLPAEIVASLREKARRGGNATFTINLALCKITDPDGQEIDFSVDEFRKNCLLNGWDDIALTLQNEADIKIFEDNIKSEKPWVAIEHNIR